MKNKKINIHGLKIQENISNLELEIFAQPIIDLIENNDFADFEILSRFYSSNKKISPVSIFENPENKNKLMNLDLLIFKESLKVLNEITSKWKYGLNNFSASINVSEMSVHNSEYFLNEINKYFLEYKNLNKSNFFLEINEKSDIGIKSFINKAISHGFGISIDDIGTSNFTISKLRKSVIPYIEDKSKLKIKIDQSFIKRLTDPENIEKPIDDGFVEMILGVQKVYPSIKIVGEGIENLSTLNCLKDKGINYGQGFYWRKPELLTSKYLQYKQ